MSEQVNDTDAVGRQAVRDLSTPPGERADQPARGGPCAQGVRPRRVLLGQLASNGDCLYVTTIARQIKCDFPGCHLTWAIGSAYRSVIDLNPDVDAVWEVPMQTADMASGRYVAIWREFHRHAVERLNNGEFDELVLTQLLPDNIANLDATIRASLFRAYNRPVTVPVAPVVRLAPAEVDNVRRFAAKHRLAECRHVVLFEASPKSQQSFVTSAMAAEIAAALVQRVPGCCVILSSDKPAEGRDERIIDGSVLSFRENAELTRFCTLLVGCSSGITWLATSDWAKPLPTVQLLARNSLWVPSVVRDLRRWGLPTDHIVEMGECPTSTIVDCIAAAALEGISAARARFHEDLPEPLRIYDSIARSLLMRGECRKFLRVLFRTGRRRRWDAPFLCWHMLTPFYFGSWVLRRALGRVRRARS